MNDSIAPASVASAAAELGVRTDLRNGVLTGVWNGVLTDVQP